MVADNERIQQIELIAVRVMEWEWRPLGKCWDTKGKHTSDGYGEGFVSGDWNPFKNPIDCELVKQKLQDLNCNTVINRRCAGRSPLVVASVIRRRIAYEAGADTEYEAVCLATVKMLLIVLQFSMNGGG